MLLELTNGFEPIPQGVAILRITILLRQQLTLDVMRASCAAFTIFTTWATCYFVIHVILLLCCYLYAQPSPTTLYDLKTVVKWLFLHHQTLA